MIAPRSLTLFEAILPIATMAGLLTFGAFALEVDTAFLLIVLLAAAAVAGAVAWRHGAGWEAICAATGRKFASVLPALLILLAIGMLIATWVLAGTIPFLVYQGILWTDPRFLVVTAFLATAMMSTFTGTSWGSAGTVGVALMGTAAALDAPMAATAGAIVSGAYFGDKMSPLSDSTNIAAIGAGADLYEHVRHMVFTAFPSAACAIVVYLLAAGPVDAGGELPEKARTLLADIDAVYRLNAFVWLPPIVVVGCILRRVPPALAIALSSLVAAAIGVGVQGFTVGDAISAAVHGVDASRLASVGIDPASLGPAFLTLVQRGGVFGMSYTLVIVLAAFLLAGAMEVSGALDLVIRRTLGGVRSAFGLVAATMLSGAVMIAMTSHGGVTSLVIGNMFQRSYADRRLAAVNLSRSIEDSVTLTEPLMPWTVSAVFMATTLGVPTSAYAPWAVFCYGGPVFSLLLAALWSRTGWGLRAAANPAPSGK